MDSIAQQILLIKCVSVIFHIKNKYKILQFENLLNLKLQESNLI